MNKSIKHIFIGSVLFLLMIGWCSATSATNIYDYDNATAFLDNITHIENNSIIIIHGSEATISDNYFINASNITIKSINGIVTFQNNKVNTAFIINGNNVTLYGITFKNFTNSLSSVGAIKWNGNNGIVENCTFTNNTAVSASAIYWVGANGRVFNSTFTNNTGVDCSSGGAIFWEGVNGTVFNSTFTKNRATLGGAIRWYGANGRVFNSTFTNNTGVDHRSMGGAIFWGGVNGRVFNSTFTNNNVLFGGGAICWVGTNGTVFNCNIINNTAQDAGAIYVVSDASNSTVACCNFIHNMADYDLGNAGAIYWGGANGDLNNCEFHNNTAFEGGAIYWYNGNGVIQNCNFTNNTGSSDNGIYLCPEKNESDNITLINNSFIKSESSNDNPNIVIGNNWMFEIFGGEGAIISFKGENSSISSGVTVIIMNNETKQVRKSETINLTAVIMADGINNIIIGLPFNFTVNNLNYTGSVKGINYEAEYITPNEYGAVAVNGVCKNVNPNNITIKTADLMVFEFADVNLIINNTTAFYGENITLNITAKNKTGKALNGNVTFIIDNIQYEESISLINGSLIHNITGLNANKHTIFIKFNNSDYYGESNIINLTIIPATPQISIGVTNITYGDNATVQVNVSGVNDNTPTGNVTLYIDGIEYNTTSLNDDGKALFLIFDLNVGEYFIEVNYTSNSDNYTDSSVNAFINVTKANPSFNIDNITYGDGELIIAGNSTVSGNITVIIGEMNQTIDIVNGSANLNITEWNLGAGNYKVEIIYSGDDNYENITLFLDFTIDKGNATFNIDNVTYSDGMIVISTNTTINGNVTITINDETKIVPINDGVADLNIIDWGLSAGNYTALINFTGNDNYTSTIIRINFTIDKSKTFININITKMGDDNVLILLNLTDGNGSLISGNVTVNVTSDNGYECLKVIPLVNGVGSLELIQLDDGIYTVIVAYNATDDYECSYMNNSFDIDYTPTNYNLNASDIVKYYKNGTQYTVKLTDGHGNPAAGKTILVTLNSSKWLNPVSYNITTNDLGIATLKINLIAGNYNIEATFPNSTSKVNNITVIEVTFVLTANDLIKYYKNGTHYVVKVTSQFGYIIPYEAVTVKVYSEKWLKPAQYTIKTNESGVVVLPINLIYGVYSITATVGKTTRYNNIAVLPTLTANNIVKKISEPGSLKARLVDGQGNPVSGKTVNFTVKSKVYPIETDVDGIATLPINLGLGTWNFLINCDNAQTRVTVKIIR